MSGATKETIIKDIDAAIKVAGLVADLFPSFTIAGKVLAAVRNDGAILETVLKAVLAS